MLERAEVKAFSGWAIVHPQRGLLEFTCALTQAGAKLACRYGFSPPEPWRAWQALGCRAIRVRIVPERGEG